MNHVDNIITLITGSSDELSVSDVRKISAVLHSVMEKIQRRARREIKIGQTVAFRDKQGCLIEGVVKKILTKNIQVVAKNWPHTTWRLSPTLVESVNGSYDPSTDSEDPLENARKTY